MDGDWLALGAVAGLAALGLARRGSRNEGLPYRVGGTVERRVVGRCDFERDLVYPWQPGDREPSADELGRYAWNQLDGQIELPCEPRFDPSPEDDELEIDDLQRLYEIRPTLAGPKVVRREW